MSGPVRFYVNDQLHQVNPDDEDLPLIDYLHEELGLTGTKFCCGTGVCRACTVGVRNKKDAVMEKTLSCSIPLSAVNGQRIYTIESLGTAENLSKLQQAFLEHFAFQCGYCTSGFLMAATALLEHLKVQPTSTEQQLDNLIQQWVGDNICRCTGYVRYIEAIKAVATELLADMEGAGQ